MHLFEARPQKDQQFSSGHHVSVNDLQVTGMSDPFVFQIGSCSSPVPSVQSIGQSRADPFLLPLGASATATNSTDLDFGTADDHITSLLLSGTNGLPKVGQPLSGAVGSKSV